MAPRKSRCAASDSPESAARFVRRRAPAIRTGYLRDGQFVPSPGAQCWALIRWAELAYKRIPFEYVEQFVYIGSGTEHRVYHDRSGKQAIKATLNGQFGHSLYAFGRSATPLEYLSRLAWHNAVFGDKIRIKGICFDGENHVEVVHSQPWIEPHNVRLTPSPEEIEQYFADLGFQRAHDDSAPPLFYNRELDLVVADAHNANLVRDEQGRIVAIDVVIGTPGPSVLAEVLRRLR